MRKKLSLLGALAALVAALAVPAASAQPATSYSGQATAVHVSVLGLVNFTAGDTGPLPAAGGSNKSSLVGVTLPGILSVGALSSSTNGNGNHSTSKSSVGDVSLTLLGVGADAGALQSQATASCKAGQPETSGSSEIAGLVLNGQPIANVVVPNLTISLPLGLSATLNEQTSSTSGTTGQMTVNAVHVTGPGVDIVLAHSEADITC